MLNRGVTEDNQHPGNEIEQHGGNINDAELMGEIVKRLSRL